MVSEPTEPASRLREALREFPEIAAAYLYGSCARNEATPLSDVDVALVISPQVSESRRGPLLRAVLRRTLGSAVTEREVDVRFFDELPTAIQGRAVTEGILVYEADAKTRVLQEATARLRYHDFLPVEEQMAKEGLHALRRTSRLRTSAAGSAAAPPHTTTRTAEPLSVTPAAQGSEHVDSSEQHDSVVAERH